MFLVLFGELIAALIFNLGKMRGATAEYPVTRTKFCVDGYAVLINSS